MVTHPEGSAWLHAAADADGAAAAGAALSPVLAWTSKSTRRPVRKMSTLEQAQSMGFQGFSGKTTMLEPEWNLLCKAQVVRLTKVM